MYSIVCVQAAITREHSEDIIHAMSDKLREVSLDMVGSLKILGYIDSLLGSQLFRLFLWVSVKANSLSESSSRVQTSYSIEFI